MLVENVFARAHMSFDIKTKVEVLTYMAKKEERQKESEASPHPGLKSLCGDTKLSQ